MSRLDTSLLDGVVLAGGRSHRMGTDKALLTIGGERLVDRAARRLAPVCNRVVVASGERQLEDLTVPQVADEVADAGPLAGLCAGLRWVSERPGAAALCAVVAVDLPDASPAVLLALARAWQGGPGVVPVVAGARQPLHAVYAPTTAAAFALQLAAGERSPRRVGRRLGVQEAAFEVWGEADPQARFARNLNRPEDLACFGRELAERRTTETMAPE